MAPPPPRSPSGRSRRPGPGKLPAGARVLSRLPAVPPPRGFAGPGRRLAAGASFPGGEAARSSGRAPGGEVPPGADEPQGAEGPTCACARSRAALAALGRRKGPCPPPPGVWGSGIPESISECGRRKGPFPLPAIVTDWGNGRLESVKCSHC